MKQQLTAYDGFEFLDSLYDNELADAHYAGATVTLGEKNRPVFWYKPAGSNDYRVIFADLTVKEMNTPPQVEGAVALKASK